MNNLHIKLFLLLFAFSYTSIALTAQTMGKPGGNTLNFFDTNSKGGQIGHSQSGSFGNFVFNSRWIGIGQPAVPSGQELYGMRIQDRDYVGTFNYTGNPANKDLEIVYGTVPVLSINEPAPSVLPDLEFRTTNNNAFSTVLRMKLTAGGTLGINTTYGGNFYKLYVGGRAYSTVGWFSPSDERYKKGISTIANATEKLSRLEGVTYDYKKEVINGIDFSEHDVKQQLGFIAQDLEKVFPELVVQDENGYYAVNYQGLIPVLVEGFNDQQETIQEQSELNSEQDVTISALNNKVSNLESQLAEILSKLNTLNSDVEFGSTPVQGQTTNVILQQNRPNPSNGLTSIDYQLPGKIKVANLIIYNLEGKQIKSFRLTESRGSINFDTSQYSAGTYLYSLIANGEKLAQQKMIIQ